MTYKTKGKKKTGKNVTIKRRRRRRSLKQNGTKRFKKRGGGGKNSLKIPPPHNYEKVTNSNSGPYNRLRVLGTDSMVNAKRGCLVANRKKNNKKSPKYNILAARGTKTLVKNKRELEERNKKKNLKGGNARSGTPIIDKESGTGSNLYISHNQGKNFIPIVPTVEVTKKSGPSIYNKLSLEKRNKNNNLKAGGVNVKKAAECYQKYQKCYKKETEDGVTENGVTENGVDVKNVVKCYHAYQKCNNPNPIYDIKKQMGHKTPSGPVYEVQGYQQVNTEPLYAAPPGNSQYNSPDNSPGNIYFNPVQPDNSGEYATLPLTYPLP